MSTTETATAPETRTFDGVQIPAAGRYVLDASVGASVRLLLGLVASPGALLKHVASINGKFSAALALVADRERSFWLDRDVSRKAQWEATRRMAELGNAAVEVKATPAAGRPTPPTAGKPVEQKPDEKPEKAGEAKPDEKPKGASR